MRSFKTALNEGGGSRSDGDGDRWSEQDHTQRGAEGVGEGSSVWSQLSLTDLEGRRPGGSSYYSLARSLLVFSKNTIYKLVERQKKPKLLRLPPPLAPLQTSVVGGAASCEPAVLVCWPGPETGSDLPLSRELRGQMMR